MIAALAIRAYQKYVPVKYKGHCPHTPHCSEYGLRAVRINGSLRGSAMAFRRWQACGALAVALLAIDGGAGSDIRRGDRCRLLSASDAVFPCDWFRGSTSYRNGCKDLGINAHPANNCPGWPKGDPSRGY
jgi:Putative membrane protein insertion efficiency factor